MFTCTTEDELVESPTVVFVSKSRNRSCNAVKNRNEKHPIEPILLMEEDLTESIFETEDDAYVCSAHAKVHQYCLLRPSLGYRSRPTRHLPTRDGIDIHQPVLLRLFVRFVARIPWGSVSH